MSSHPYQVIVVILYFKCLVYIFYFRGSPPYLVFIDQKKKRKDWKKGLKEACVHLPMLVPLQIAYHAFDLYAVEYSDQMSIESLTKIEELKMKAGKLSVNEAFTVCSKVGHLNYAYIFLSYIGVRAPANPSTAHYQLHGIP